MSYFNLLLAVLAVITPLKANYLGPLYDPPSHVDAATSYPDGMKDDYSHNRDSSPGASQTYGSDGTGYVKQLKANYFGPLYDPPSHVDAGTSYPDGMKDDYSHNRDSSPGASQTYGSDGTEYVNEKAQSASGGSIDGHMSYDGASHAVNYGQSGTQTDQYPANINSGGYAAVAQSYDRLSPSETHGYAGAQPIGYAAGATSFAGYPAKSYPVQSQQDSLSTNPSYPHIKNAQQPVYSSVHLPTAKKNHRVIVTPGLPPAVICLDAKPMVEVPSGPPYIIKRPPVIYKFAPSVIYQHEVINKQPAPLHLHPLYVNVYKTVKNPADNAYGAQPDSGYKVKY